MKKYAQLLTLICLIMPLGAHASTNGFYGGVSTGYGYNDFDLEAGTATTGPTQFDQAVFDSFEYGVLTGHHWNFNENYFLETELNFTFGKGKANNLFSSPLHVEKNYSYGFNVKPGYQLNDKWAPFVLLGWQWVNYEANYAPTNFSAHETGHGFNYGVGVNYALNEKMTLTGEYHRVQITDITFNHGPGTLNSRVDPELDTVKIALKYHF